MMKDYMKIIFILWLLLILFNIFYKDSNVVSQKISSEITTKVTADVAAITDGDDIKILTKRINYTIRKSGHFFQYFILSILIVYMLKHYKINARECVFITLFICLFIANLDEYCQSFLSYRSSLVEDVVMDFVGSLVGMVFALIFVGASQSEGDAP